MEMLLGLISDEDRLQDAQKLISLKKSGSNKDWRKLNKIGISTSVYWYFQYSFWRFLIGLPRCHQIFIYYRQRVDIKIRIIVIVLKYHIVWD
jgi:hypothetical protein